MTARFAPVAPLRILQQLDKMDLLGKYHLLLAHDVVAHPKEYEALFKNKDMTIIMDNSLIELGHPVEAEVMAEAVEIVDATFAVLPDKLSDMEETVKLTIKGLEDLSRIDLHKRCDYLGVVQGKTLEEIQQCYTRITLEDPACLITTWSVPKVTQSFLGSRYEPTMWLAQQEEVRNIHLLGFSDSIRDDMLTAHVEKVMGIDSAVPIRLGTSGITITRDPSFRAPPRGDWFETVQSKDIDLHVRSNIDLVRYWLL